MDNLLLANGVPPERKENQKVYTRLSSAAAQFRGKQSTDSDNRPKVDGLPSESLADLARNQWIVSIGLGGRFASESVVRLARNTQDLQTGERSWPCRSFSGGLAPSMAMRRTSVSFCSRGEVSSSLPPIEDGPWWPYQFPRLPDYQPVHVELSEKREEDRSASDDSTGLEVIMSDNRIKRDELYEQV
jgi:hypothetical protein